MLNTVYKGAIMKREQMLSVLRGPGFERIMDRARESWVSYRPSKREASIAGIDSSFNNTRFQGIELWAAAAVSVKTDGEILADTDETGFGNGKDIAKMASSMETQMCEKSVDRAGLVLMDGSLYSQFMTRQPEAGGRIADIMKRKNNVLFVSKTSNTNREFNDLKPLAGDIFYYNRVTTDPGYSRPHVEKEFGPGRVITSVFARLGDSTPLIKIEFLGDSPGEERIREVLDMLYGGSVGGYPYALKLAHNKCKISDKDLSKMVSMLGLSNEVGSREVLG